MSVVELLLDTILVRIEEFVLGGEGRIVDVIVVIIPPGPEEVKVVRERVGIALVVVNKVEEELVTLVDSCEVVSVVLDLVVELVDIEVEVEVRGGVGVADTLLLVVKATERDISRRSFMLFKD